MQIAREVAVVLSSHPERVQVKDFKLVFEEAKVENAPPPEPTIPEDLFPPVAPEDLEDVAKAQWFRAVGYRPDGC